MDAFLELIHQALNYLQTIKITDLIDIAIISYIFYKILQFAKETQAGQVLRGIVLVVAMLWLSNVLNLHVLSYILSKNGRAGLSGAHYCVSSRKSGTSWNKWAVGSFAYPPTASACPGQSWKLLLMRQ